MHLPLRLSILLPATAFAVALATAQTAPVEGLRKSTPAIHALVNARIVHAPGKVTDDGILVIRDGVVVSAGRGAAPPDARLWDMRGLTIYPGLIDASSDYGMPKPPAAGTQEQQRQPEQRGAGDWNPHVLAHQNAVQLFAPDPKAAEKLRAAGITTVLAVPPRGIFRGTSALVTTGDGAPNRLVVKPRVAHHIALAVPPSEGYPSSLMGTIALIRQTLYDARWYRAAEEAVAKNPALPRPERNEALAALREAADGRMPVVIEASSAWDVLRADAIAREFGLDAAIRGTGAEYLRLEAVRATKRAMLIPVNFPDPPAVQTPEEALQVSLAELRHWDEAPDNPWRLRKEGVSLAFTTSGLKDPATLLKRVRRAVERGLPRDEALASLTVVPARLFGVDKTLGTLEPGRAATFLVADGDLFAGKTIIHETWIDGRRYEVRPRPEVDVRGTWRLTWTGLPAEDSLLLFVKGEGDAPRASVKTKREMPAKSFEIQQAGRRVALAFAGDSLGIPGVLRLTGLVRGEAMEGKGERPDGSALRWSATRVAGFVPEPDTAAAKRPDSASFPPLYPPGEYGRPEPPAQPAAVVVRGATVWTSGPDGRLENADLLVQRGRIVRVGRGLEAPADAVVIDGRGKHVTPGLIDAHSHMAVEGSVNEGAQAISAEVRIGDVLDPDDISIYRSLAGGLVAAHVLHGSANPIGGQSQFIKLRWGSLPEALKVEGCPPTIKFALGENVKQSNWGDRHTSRYPQTRMGVEQLMRDAFRRALDYERAWKAYEKKKAGIPPRRDLELDALLDVVRGTRLVHCHSYRQDEILAMMRVAEEYGFRIRVFQHILEGYKVADVMAQHGAGGSSFSDWWGYKLEVYDAIPHNGALMHAQGVLVSFNSDSDELSRRMNLEAAKAVKYGGVAEMEALKFVTINPAMQMKTDARMGSLEPGKDADFVVWSGHPLSTYTVCEQTWVDGRRLFDLGDDLRLREEARRQRAVLIQKAVAAPRPPGTDGPVPGGPRTADLTARGTRHGRCEEGRP